MSNTALLVMDVQPGIVDRLADKDAFLERASHTVATAKEQGIVVIYMVVGFRPGFPEVSPHNESFSKLATTSSEYLVNPRPALKLEAGDIVVLKRRISAFSGSDLEILLRAKDINHLMLSGIATSGVVLSTLREAADKDYHLTVLSDLCADSDSEVHEVLLNKVFPRQAAVLDTSSWFKDINPKIKEANV